MKQPATELINYTTASAVRPCPETAPPPELATSEPVAPLAAHLAKLQEGRVVWGDVQVGDVGVTTFRYETYEICMKLHPQFLCFLLGGMFFLAVVWYHTLEVISSSGFEDCHKRCSTVLSIQQYHLNIRMSVS